MSKINLADAQLSMIKEGIAPRPKFNSSFENKIENLWLQSEGLGWSYNDFTAHFLEVLIILRHRDRVKRMAASKSRIAA